MAIRFPCPQCCTTLRVPDDKAGKKGRCPKCGGVIAVPAAARIVNDVWRRRGELQPDLTCNEPPGLLAIYRLLPRTNCAQCGRSTCMAFARDLREQAAQLAQCAPLREPPHAQQLAQLLELMGEAV